jgi:hypothetical protein
MMRMNLAVIFVSAAVGSADAAPACNGRLATRTGPTGTTLQVCLDGKYTTCVQDSQRLGYAPASAKRFCDDLRAKGRVK